MVGGIVGGGAGVSDFFNYEPKFKIKKKLVGVGVWGRGRGMRGS